MTETPIGQIVWAREASNVIVELGITLAKDEQLEPEAVRHMWKCVMETVAELIGVDKVISSAVVVDGGTRKPFFVEVECPDDDAPFPFGRNKGETYGELDDSYYKWLSQQEWIDNWPDVLSYIQANDLD